MENNISKEERNKIKNEFDFKKLLHKNSEMFCNLFHNAKDFIFVTQMKEDGLPSSIIEVNDITCSKLGYTREELLELPPQNIGRHIDNINIEKIKKNFLDKQYASFEMLFIAKTGENLIIEISASIFALDGQKFVLSVGRDITQRKKIQKELIENNKEYKATLDKLKHTQEQLVQKEKLAGIGQLAAGVAHEINNPLGYISSNFETSKEYFTKYKEILNAYRSLIDNLSHIKRETLEGKIKGVKSLEENMDVDFILMDMEEMFRDIEDGLQRITEIVTSLKTFSRVDMTSQVEEYNFNQGIKNTLLIARNEIKHNARVVEILSDIPIIKAFGNQINQVLLNIIFNATDAIKEKQSSDLGLIIVRTQLLKEYVLCEIEDNGIGIEDKDMDKIFNPFFTTKPAGEGTGLGLSIAYDIIVNKHGGKIKVESTPEIGTKFIIKLPIN